MNIELIKSKIKNVEPYINGFEEMKRAAVIIPLVEIQGKTNILFEVRAKKMKSQPGDICFPGGKIDLLETPKEAALREIYEELNLSNIEIVNELDTLIRHDGIIIHPFLGIIQNIENLNISRDEVDHVFYVPLDYLINQKPIEVISKVELKRSDDFPYELIFSGKDYKFKDGEEKVLFYNFEGHVIWGITAKMLKSFFNKIV
ncbi:NUDIX hydrolase [Clostridium vincentii]|uniref:Putative NUDIX hydrolase n=1 Tax=Clostridium vincentii TaxID=52704 RepID=A0A2T0BL33_9CLOT|nr:CoA pyrophosphatase [Clostridium vincentii]PRR84596.1 putative NUDIX hydrolase [Clostridium vincentii]